MRNKKLSDKQKLRDLSTTQAALQQMLTGLIQSRNTRDKNQPLAIKKMAIGIYISIITLNVNGLNAPTKRHRLAEWIQNKTHIYVVYKKSTSDLKTHID